MRGRKPQPAAVQKQKAAVRSTRAKAVTPQAVTVASVQPTRQLGELALKVWNVLAPRLAAAKLLGELDAAAFTRYCQLSARYEASERAIDEDGIVYWTESVHGKLKRANPAALLSLRYSRELAHFEANFGLTPADRQRIFADRARGGAPGDLFGGSDQPQQPAKGEAPAAPAPKDEGPIGLLN